MALSNTPVLYKVKKKRKIIKAIIASAVIMFFFLVFLSGIIIIFYLSEKGQKLKINIFVYSLLMLPVIIFPYLIDFVGLTFLVPSLLLTFYYNFL